MGLYDTPLPPPPERQGDSNDKNMDEESQIPTAKQIFRFNVDGQERRGLLPRLSRRLDSGIACYFEESDRLVQNLMEKTECHPKDAAWALEACKGDMTEAWTRISVARRQLLDERNKLIGGTLTSQVSELMAENEFEIQKEERNETKKEESRRECFKPSKPDEDWLPTKNPQPVDDEPWFTG
jgi:hypothetical protein